MLTCRPAGKASPAFLAFTLLGLPDAAISFLIIDVVIVVAFIAGPWPHKTQYSVANWLKDGIVGVIVFVIWAGIALYLATQTIIWLGFVP